MMSLHLVAAAGCQQPKPLQVERSLICARQPILLALLYPLRQLGNDWRKKKGFWGTGLALDYKDLIKDLEKQQELKQTLILIISWNLFIF